jgi:type I restriction enzyme M protein
MFIQAMLNRERWRYSYYRKCYMEKLNRVKVLLPTKNNDIDEDAIRSIVTAAPYWTFIESHIPAVDVTAAPLT